MPRFEDSTVTKLSQSELISGFDDQSSYLSRFAYSCADAYVDRAITAPIKAISQLTRSAPLATEAQPARRPDSAEYHGKLFGEAAAIATHLLVAKKLGGAILGEKVGASAIQKLEAKSINREFVTGAAFGFAYEGLLTPSSEKELASKGLLRSRLETALGGAAVFGSMKATAGLMANAGIVAEAKGFKTLNTMLSNGALMGVVAGVPGGIVAAESNALIKQNRHASLDEFGESIYGMSLVGFGFCSMSRFAENNATAGSGIRNSFSEMRNGFNDFRETVSNKLGNIAQQGDALMEQLLGPKLQPAFAMQGSGMSPADYRLEMRAGRTEARASKTEPTGSKRLDVSASDRQTGLGSDRIVSPGQIFKYQEIVQRDIIPKIQEAEQANKVTAAIQLDQRMPMKDQLGLKESLRSLGYVVELFHEQGRAPDLLISWSPLYTKKVTTLQSLFAQDEQKYELDRTDSGDERPYERRFESSKFSAAVSSARSAAISAARPPIASENSANIKATVKVQSLEPTKAANAPLPVIPVPLIPKVTAIKPLQVEPLVASESPARPLTKAEKLIRSAREKLASKVVGSSVPSTPIRTALEAAQTEQPIPKSSARSAARSSSSKMF